MLYENYILNIKNISINLVRFSGYLSHIYEVGDRVSNEEFEKIYNLYFRDVYYYILSLCRNKDLAEDITSESFLKAIKAIDGFRGETKLRVWLCQIAKNEYFSYLRQNSRIDLKEDLNELANMGSSYELEKEVVSKDEFLRINNIIDSSLEEVYAEIFRLRTYGELSFKEIGGLFEKTDNWACVIYHRARKKLQKGLEGKL